MTESERKVMEQALAALRNAELSNMEQLNAMYALQEELAKPGIFEEWQEKYNTMRLFYEQRLKFLEEMLEKSMEVNLLLLNKPQRKEEKFDGLI